MVTQHSSDSSASYSNDARLFWICNFFMSESYSKCYLKIVLSIGTLFFHSLSLSLFLNTKYLQTNLQVEQIPNKNSIEPRNTTVFIAWVFHSVTAKRLVIITISLILSNSSHFNPHINNHYYPSSI